MPIDASMYSNNPMDAFSSSLMTGAKLGDLARQNQENQSVKDAFKNNVVTAADGSTSLNQQGVLSDLYKTNPEKGLAYQKSFSEQAKIAREDQIAKTKQQVDQLDIVGRLAGSAIDQPTYDQALQTAQKMGIDVSQLPKQYDPNHINMVRSQALTAKEQSDQKYKALTAEHENQRIAIEQQKADAQKQEVGIKRQDQRNTKSSQSAQQTIQLLESARGNPAAAQAEKDLYSAQKIDSLINLYGDPNKLNPQMVHLVASEVAKIAQGGAPRMGELKDLSPSTIPSSLADIAQTFNNAPTAANAGAFLKQFQDYSNALKGDAKKVIQDKYGRIIDTKKQSLSPEDYASLKTNYVDRFNKTPSQSASQGKPQTVIQNGHTYTLNPQTGQYE